MGKRKIIPQAFENIDEHLQYCVGCKVNQYNLLKADKKFKEELSHHLKYGILWNKNYTITTKPINEVIS